jgi:hypothetical protein
MATWTNLPDASLEPGKPIRSIDGLALRDNPIAISEGAAGAPQIQTAALVTGERMNTGNVQTAIAGSNFGDLGTTVIAWNASTSSVSSGGTIAGSNLRYRTAAPTNMFSNVGDGDGTPNPPFPTTNYSALSGTWRNMGSFCSGRTVTGSFDPENPYFGTWYPSMWLRIA